MTRYAFFIMAFAVLFVAALQARAAEKVLLDTDMVEGFDDGVAMLLLANAPEVELAGVTTVAGNSWPAEGAAFALRQLEIMGHDVPVHEGLALPFRPGRVEFFAGERQRFGIGADQWVGALDRPDPKDWLALYRKRYGREPGLRTKPQHAVDFIIDLVRTNPGEITIAAIGPATNLAMAVRKAPDIVPLIKRVVYMGGAFFQPGNVTPAAEFNWWFDPEAARMAVRTPFREQIIVGLDVCEKMIFTRDRYRALLEAMDNPEMAALLDGTFAGRSFAADADFRTFIWDVVTAVIIIDPTLVTAQAVHTIDVNDDYGLSYGQSLAYVSTGPEGALPATIILDIDQDRFWNMLLSPARWRASDR